MIRAPATPDNQHDIALVILSTSFVYEVQQVWPVCLNFDKDLDKKSLLEGHVRKVAGWDQTKKDVQDIFQVMELPNVDIQQCILEASAIRMVLGKQPLHITSDKICAGHNTSEPLCEYDSGAGFALAEHDRRDPRKRRYCLRGVVSLFNYLVCIWDFYTVFTKVSAHEDFIRDNSVGVIF
ncbi:Phenoloxidase-activating factor 1 [Eumeta japonica]|uniref:Phenoloxidase-activating factor 1 n=1 Tax=Eumeta variegata TaxID=151549 RepID=A0A4C1V413_EUMVA|nr:Phenoloxidase-activating factor 1 [Eumeta japonica]